MNLKNLQLILLLSCFIFLIFIIKDINSSKIKDIILNADIKFILLAILASAINILFKVYRLKIISYQFGLKISLWLAYKTQVASLLFAMLTPGRVGEVSKVYLLAENDKNKYSIITGIMFFEIIMDFICIIFISLIFSFFIMKSYILSLFSLILLIVGFVGLYMSIKSHKLLNFLPKKIKNIFGSINEIEVNLYYKWYLNLILTMGAWFLDGVFQFYLLKSISNENDILTLVSLSAMNSVISVLSILPLGLGVTDISSIFLYKKFAYLGNEQILFLVNSTRIFIIFTLILMAIPFIKTLLSINIKAIKKDID